MDSNFSCYPWTAKLAFVLVFQPSDLALSWRADIPTFYITKLDFSFLQVSSDFNKSLETTAAAAAAAAITTTTTTITTTTTTTTTT